VRPAVLGAIAVATIPLMQTAIVERSAVALGAIAAAIGFRSLIALIRFQVPTWQLVLGGGGLGLLTSLMFRSSCA